ncbi:MAG: DUF2484 family protein [Pseudomonadota bacterium]
MIWSLVAFVLWLLATTLTARVSCPTRQGRAAMGLVIAGIPLLGWITWLNGPVWGGLALVIGCVVLRLPIARLVSGQNETQRLQEPAE